MDDRAEIRKLKKEALEKVEALEVAMREFFDNKSEAWQISEKGDDWQLRADEIMFTAETIRDNA